MWIFMFHCRSNHMLDSGVLFHSPGFVFTFLKPAPSEFGNTAGPREAHRMLHSPAPETDWVPVSSDASFPHAPHLSSFSCRISDRSLKHPPRRLVLQHLFSTVLPMGSKSPWPISQWQSDVAHLKNMGKYSANQFQGDTENMTQRVDFESWKGC